MILGAAMLLWGLAYAVAGAASLIGLIGTPDGWGENAAVY